MKLNINYNNIFTSYCWLFNRFSIISNNIDYVKTTLDKFMLFRLNDKYHLQIGFENTDDINSILDDICNVKYINHIDAKKLVDNLSGGYYVLIKCDKYYIKSTDLYHLKHEYYEILLYGYNLKKKVFYFADYDNKNMIWTEKTLDFIEIEVAFNSVIQLHNENYSKYYELFCNNLCYCVLLKLKLKVVTDDHLIRKLFRQNLYKYLHTIYADNLFYGISIYDGLSQYYNEDYDELINNETLKFKYLIVFKTFIESKRLLLLKCNYIIGKNLDQNGCSIIKGLEQAFLVVIKSFYVRKKFLDINRIMTKLKETELILLGGVLNGAFYE